MQDRFCAYASPPPVMASRTSKPATCQAAPPRLLWSIMLWGMGSILLIFLLCTQASAADPDPANSPPPVLTYCFQGIMPQTRVVVVDKARQRLMVFKYMGEMILEREYPCSTGAKPGSKLEQGDERTPVGVYFTTHRYQDRKITVFGDKAIHLNYPNPMDQVAGRKGNGIYLHGTNQTLRPFSTNGCVVMRNEDLADVAPLISEQITPVVVVERLNWAGLEQRNQACNFLRHLESRAFEKKEAKLNPQLALVEPGQRAANNFSQLAPRLGGMVSAQMTQVKNLNLVLVGLDKQWVLLSEQSIKGPSQREVRVTRRHYLLSERPPQLDLVQDEWILANQDVARQLAAWAPEVPMRRTPRSEASPASAPSATPAPVAVVEPEKEVRHMLELWLSAWQNKKLRYFMSFYDQSFSSDGMDRKAWQKQKAYLNRVYKVIRVQAKEISVQVNGNRAQVRFVQHYRSDWHRDVGIKTLKLVKRGDKWRIVKESWEPSRQRASRLPSLGSSS